MTNGPLNVWETWPLYDSVLIGNRTEITSVDGWVGTYAALGGLRDIPFFNVRNKSSAGEQYCNFDAKEILPFAYEAFSLGVEFYAPGMGQWIAGVTPTASSADGSLFAAELPKHAAIQFKVKQDEKLINAVLLSPPGTGIDGMSTGIADGLTENYGHFQNFANGDDFLKNRWKFAEPIKIPRNANLEAKIIFSEYARGVLQAMVGPGVYVMNESPGDQFERACMIRVSLIGKREVQRRGEYHY